MGIIKGLAALITLIVMAWASLLVVIIVIDIAILRLIPLSWLRSVAGISLYFIWLALSYKVIMTIAKKKLRKAGS